MSCVVQWWDVLFVKGMHFSSKNARLLNLNYFRLFNSKYVQYKMLPMTGFEPQISAIGSDRSAK